jgi:hypothetical protein
MGNFHDWSAIRNWRSRSPAISVLFLFICYDNVKQVQTSLQAVQCCVFCVQLHKFGLVAWSSIPLCVNVILLNVHKVIASACLWCTGIRLQTVSDGILLTLNAYFTQNNAGKLPSCHFWRHQNCSFSLLVETIHITKCCKHGSTVKLQYKVVGCRQL